MAEKGYIFNIQKFSLHDGRGIRTDVFFHGCNLRCGWCANPECRIPLENPLCEARAYTIEEIVTEVLKDKVFYDKSGGGVTLTGGEVFTQFDFALKLCRALREKGVSVALETAGFTDKNKFETLTRETDFVFIDCKHYDEQKFFEGTGGKLSVVTENIKELIRSGKEYCVRIPVIRGYNDALSDASNFCRLFFELGIKDIQLLPFHQFGEKKYQNLGLKYKYANVPPLHEEDLAEYREIFIGNGFNAEIGG